MVIKINEVYLGSKEQVEIIAEDLQIHRKNCLEKYNNERLLSRLRNKSLIDSDLFNDAIRTAEMTMRSYFSEFVMFPEDRYYVHEPEDVGGFYGIPAGGFLHTEYIGFTSFLDFEKIKNVELRTIELFRNYFHDSFHANTFKSYKLNTQTQKPYRYQYGINYRDKDGISYSSAHLSRESPLKINLNLLMDGVTQIFISECISKNYRHVFKTDQMNEFEKEILVEILDCEFKDKHFYQPKKFYEEILSPTKLFLSFWGKNILYLEIIRSMFSGKLKTLRNYFNLKMGIENGWEKVFKQDLFNELEI